MTAETTGAAPRGGVRTALDMIVAPTSAFDSLRAVPTWGWALGFTLVATAVGSYLTIPAYHHFVETALPGMLAKNPRIAQLAPDQQAQQIKAIVSAQQTFANFNFLIVPVVVAIGFLLQALVMLVARIAGGGEGNLRRFWALACNAGLVGSGLGSLALGLICLLRGPASFNATSDFQTILPSLALVAPGASPPVVAFLGSANVFYVWSAALIALGLVRIARVRPIVAWLTAALFVILPGLFAAFGARGT